MAATAIVLRPLTVSELDWLNDVEREAAAAGFVRNDSEATHRQQMTDCDCSYLCAEGDSLRLGYAILRGLAGESGCIQLKRIVIAQPGRGIGQVVMRALIAHVFGVLGAHRLWLDTLAGNTRSHHVYAKLGFVHEGLLREATLINGQHQDLIVFGLLAREWTVDLGADAKPIATL